MSRYSKRFLIELRPEEYELLCQLAANERRTPQHQAAIYIEEAIVRQAQDNAHVGHQLPIEALREKLGLPEPPQMDTSYAHATETGNEAELGPMSEEQYREAQIAHQRKIGEAIYRRAKEEDARKQEDGDGPQ